MKLSSKTLLSFIGVILFQAGLTISILSYFIYQQNKEISVNEMRKEAKVVYKNYNGWKTHFWKNLITLKRNNSLKEQTRLLGKGGNDEQQIQALEMVANSVKELLFTSGIDFIAVKSKDQLVARTLSEEKSSFTNLFSLLPKQSKDYPYIENRVMDNNLTLIGVINLGLETNSDLNIYLIKIIDNQFISKLVINPNTETFFYIDEIFTDGQINGARIDDEILFKPLNHFYNILTDLRFNNVQYNGIVKKIGYMAHPDGKKRMFLGTLIASDSYSSGETLVYNLIFSVFILGSLLAIGISFFLSRNISHPVGVLLAAMKKIKTGRFDNPVKGRFSTEIQELFVGFNNMLRNLNRQKDTMEKYFQEISSLKDYNERIIDSISTGIVSINNIFYVEKVNQGFLDLFDATEKSIIDKDIRSINLECFEPQLIVNVRKILHRDHSSFTLIKRFSPRRIFEIKFYRIYTKDSHIGCVLLFNDISKKMELEEKILQAEKLSSLSILSAGVAHEINNPLNSIMSNVQYLAEDEVDETKIESLKWIKHETNRIGEIIKRLLDFADNGQSQQTISDVNEEISKVINLIQFSLKKNVQITSSLDPLNPKSLICPEEFKQVIINLLNNAIQACGNNGKVTIETQYLYDKKLIFITISDDGQGISDDILHKIFDPFFTTKPTGKGTGLGLSVVYGIINKSNGDINVESTKGKGTAFKIIIPGI